MPAASVLKAAMCTFDTLGCNVHRAELALCVGEVMQYYSIPCCAQYASPQLQIPFCGQQTNIIHTCRTGSISCRDIRARNTVFRIGVSLREERRVRRRWGSSRKVGYRNQDWPWAGLCLCLWLPAPHRLCLCSMAANQARPVQGQPRHNCLV